MKNTPGRPFQPGNTFGRGRPQGSRNKATIALQEMLDSHGESITRKCALLAMQGDPTALRLCMERLIPPRRDSPVKFKLPPVNTAAEVGRAIGTVLHDVAGGQLTPAEGQMVSSILEDRRKAIETDDILGRLEELERAAESRPGPHAEVLPPSGGMDVIARLNASRERIRREDELEAAKSANSVRDASSPTTPSLASDGTPSRESRFEKPEEKVVGDHDEGKQ